MINLNNLQIIIFLLNYRGIKYLNKKINSNNNLNIKNLRLFAQVQLINLITKNNIKYFLNNPFNQIKFTKYLKDLNQEEKYKTLLRDHMINLTID